MYFIDEECTCECGNKHELYGGKGYTLIRLEANAGGLEGEGYYIREDICNVCGKKYTYKAF